MIAKWYPYQEDPQFGVFIQKHAQAISLENKVAVIYAYSKEGQKEKYRTEIIHRNDLLEVVISYKKSIGIFGGILNGIRYFKAVNFGRKKTTALFKKPDLIHAYILLRTAVLARYFSFVYKIPYVINEQWSGYATGKFSRLPHFKKHLTKILVQRSSGLISVSDFLLSNMHSCGIRHTREIVIPNSIEAVEQIKSSDEKTVNVLLVADLVDEIKNISAVIRAVAKLKFDNPDFVLRIIGQGVDREQLVETARELGVLNSHVIFEGLKSNEEVYSYLGKCDFLVMNSRFETFSLICCEALSCGKPVLATRCGGPQEFIDEECGILIDVNDEDALTENFLFMLKNFKRFDSHKIISKVKTRFSKEKISGMFSGFYDKVLNK